MLMLTLVGLARLRLMAIKMTICIMYAPDHDHDHQLANGMASTSEHQAELQNDKSIIPAAADAASPRPADSSCPLGRPACSKCC